MMKKKGPIAGATLATAQVSLGYWVFVVGAMQFTLAVPFVADNAPNVQFNVVPLIVMFQLKFERTPPTSVKAWTPNSDSTGTAGEPVSAVTFEKVRGTTVPGVTVKTIGEEPDELEEPEVPEEPDELEEVEVAGGVRAGIWTTCGFPEVSLYPTENAVACCCTSVSFT